MKPERREVIGSHTVEEFYWSGKLIVYIDNYHTFETFEQAVARLKEMIDKDHKGGC